VNAYVDKVPGVHRGRAPTASTLRWLVDEGESSRCSIGDLSYQVNGADAGDVPIEAAFRALRAVRLPPHDRTYLITLLAAPDAGPAGTSGKTGGFTDDDWSPESPVLT
jgi:hypothetical protein